MEIELHNYRFSVHMQGGFQNDIWALGGNVYGHPAYPDGHFVYVSTPKFFDRQSETIRGLSGRIYNLINPSGDKEKTFQEIEKVIQQGGYKRC